MTTGPISRPRRAGELGTDEDNETLVEALRDGLPLEDIAQQLGRGVDAAASQCARLLPADTRVKRGDADLVLRSLLADPAYDWRVAARERAERAGSFYWDQRAQQILASSWQQALSMAEIMTALGASESEIASRLVRVGLASGVAEVVDRLGAIEGGTLEIRVRMQADRAAAAVWVLIVDAARGSQRARNLDHHPTPTAYRHVSLHASESDAEQQLVRLLAEHLERGGDPDEVTTTLAQRTVGEHTIGVTHYEHAPTLTDLT